MKVAVQQFVQQVLLRGEPLLRYHVWPRNGHVLLQPFGWRANVVPPRPRGSSGLSTLRGALRVLPVRAKGLSDVLSVEATDSWYGRPWRLARVAPPASGTAGDTRCIDRQLGDTTMNRLSGEPGTS